MNEIQRAIEANQARFLADFDELLAFPTVAGNDEALSAAASWLARRLEALGAAVELWGPAGSPPVVFGQIGSGARSLLAYGHYDVQPAEPLEEWDVPPFAATVREGKLYGRGAGDDKGDVLAYIHAVEVYREVYGALPLRLKFFFEGEEESGSVFLADLAAAHAGVLRADGVLWEGGGLDAAGNYAVYCGVKGIQGVELRLEGARYDLHSSYAPIVRNPAWRLVHALGTLVDAGQRVTIDGFMDHVRPPTDLEKTAIARIGFPAAELKDEWGISSFLEDMDDREACRRLLVDPTCTICGLMSGHIGEGEKNVVPSAASAKLDFRLVPDLTPELVLQLLRQHLDRRGFEDIQILPFPGLAGARSDLSAPIVRAVVEAAGQVYGRPPVVYPTDPAAGPMEALVTGLGANGVMVGVSYAGTRMHAPNENIRLEDYSRALELLVRCFAGFAALNV